MRSTKVSVDAMLKLMVIVVLAFGCGESHVASDGGADAPNDATSDAALNAFA